MLLNLLKELEGEDVFVFDDGSDYDHSKHSKYCNYRRVKHHGKKMFWLLWRNILEAAKTLPDEEFIFLQDDLCNIDLAGLRKESESHEGAFVLNMFDVGPDRGWTKKGYCDCNFITNRQTLAKIGFSIMPVFYSRWSSNENLSSGVGMRLSQAFYNHNVPMILPAQNYASHGDHESLMNPEERKINPLII